MKSENCEQQNEEKSLFRWPPMIKKGRIIRFRPVIEVKSAEISRSLSLQRERDVLESLRSCRYIRHCFGGKITTGEGGEEVYNLFLEHGGAGTLADRIDESDGSGLPEKEVWHYTRCILTALAHIHAHGYIHRDLTLENIMLIPLVSESGSIEFIAKIRDYESVMEINRAKRLIWNPYFKKNLRYLAPEEFVQRNQGFGSDIWAVGCIVFEMLTGKPLWDGKHESEIREILYQMARRGRKMHAILDELSENGKEFLKICFERRSTSRWTAELLLNLPIFYQELQQQSLPVDPEASDSEASTNGIVLTHC